MISVVSNLTGKQRQETTWFSVVIDVWQRTDVSRYESCKAVLVTNHDERPFCKPTPTKFYQYLM